MPLDPQGGKREDILVAARSKHSIRVHPWYFIIRHRDTPADLHTGKAGWSYVTAGKKKKNGFTSTHPFTPIRVCCIVFMVSWIVYIWLVVSLVLFVCLLFRLLPNFSSAQLAIDFVLILFICISSFSSLRFFCVCLRVFLFSLLFSFDTKSPFSPPFVSCNPSRTRRTLDASERS